MSDSIHQAALAALLCENIEEKQRLTHAIRANFQCQELTLDDSEGAHTISTPGRPEKPLLVSPRDLVQRKLSTKEGHGAFVHAIAHIEFNAINLALDAVYRFHGLPEAYYQDWLVVAAEEAKHFNLLNQRLNALGFNYGDFPAHNGLWDMALRTEDDLLKRMALVPRVFEARGLDVTPGMIDRLNSICDTETANVLKIILADEIGHVGIGNRWFHYACEINCLNPQEAFLNLISEYFPGKLRGKFNYDARLKAGFTREELDGLQHKFG